MKNKIAAVSGLVLLLTGCVTPPEEATSATTAFVKTETIPADALNLDAMAKQRTIDLENIALSNRTDAVNRAIAQLKKTVGKTWYVFSGNTPAGWDCSGLTMWFYGQLNIEVEHRASRQDTAGTKAVEPKPGDIVVFHYRGSTDAYHVGIYVGNGQMIHAPKRGHLTRVEDIKTFGGNYSDISYRRILETL
jgi:cell wall-associated NlpC family hydrolase